MLGVLQPKGVGILEKEKTNIPFGQLGGETPYLFEVLRECGPATRPLLPLDDPDASLQVLAGHP